MKKQRVRPQDHPLLYDSHVVGHINNLTHSHYYAGFTWRQDLHLLHPPLVPTEVEQVFRRNEENKKATEKMKLLRLILAERMRLNSKEATHQPPADYKDRKGLQTQLKEEELDQMLLSASRWREEPVHHKQRLALKSRVPLHMMTSATMGTLPLNKPGTAQPRSSDFLQYASNPHFKDLLDLVQRKNPDSVLLGGQAKRTPSSRYLE